MNGHNKRLLSSLLETFYFLNFSQKASLEDIYPILGIRLDKMCEVYLEKKKNSYLMEYCQR